MIIREASASDAPRLAEIQNPVIRETSVTFNSQERTSADICQAIGVLPCFLVAELDGVVMGFVSYDQFRKGPGYSRTAEHTIVLADGARGMGVGRALMRAVEDHARDAGYGSLWAGVSAENPEGVLFHARLGYEEIARLPNVGYKFGRWMDLVLMRKWLDPSDS